jgi:hypothetical protein
MPFPDSCKLYDVIRILHIHRPSRESELPRVGETATIVFVLGEGAAYILECVDADGMTRWLAEFERADLDCEVVWTAPNE